MVIGGVGVLACAFGVIGCFGKSWARVPLFLAAVVGALLAWMLFFDTSEGIAYPAYMVLLGLVALLGFVALLILRTRRSR